MPEPEEIHVEIDVEKYEAAVAETERQYDTFMDSPMGKMLADWDPTEKED